MWFVEIENCNHDGQLRGILPHHFRGQAPRVSLDVNNTRFSIPHINTFPNAVFLLIVVYHSFKKNENTTECLNGFERAVELPE